MRMELDSLESEFQRLSPPPTPPGSRPSSRARAVHRRGSQSAASQKALSGVRGVSNIPPPPPAAPRGNIAVPAPRAGGNAPSQGRPPRGNILAAAPAGPGGARAARSPSPEAAAPRGNIAGLAPERSAGDVAGAGGMAFKPAFQKLKARVNARRPAAPAAGKEPESVPAANPSRASRARNA